MKKKKKKRHIFAKLLLALILVVGILLLDSNVRLVTTDHTLAYRNLPASFDGFRIAQLSDIHAAEFGKDNSRLISRVQKARPNIIVITGDLIDAPGQLDFVTTLCTSLMEIAPVYYITGNHEWSSGDIRALLALLPELGVTVLRNEYETLTVGNESIILAGLDDPNGRADMIKPPDFIAKIRANEGDKFLIVLYHRNKYLDLFADLGADLVLSGHAHGGIIRLPFTEGLIGPSREWLPTFTSGVYTEGRTNMVVSRGVGNNTGFPRFLNNPEIVAVVLRTK